MFSLTADVAVTALLPAIVVMKKIVEKDAADGLFNSPPCLSVKIYILSAHRKRDSHN